MPSPAVELAASLARPFEGFRAAPYHDPVGYPTIGYGHLLSREKWAPLDRWKPLTQDEGEALLYADMGIAMAAVRRLCPVDLKVNQAAALADFAFNCGAGNLQASALRQAVLRGDHESAAKQFERWVWSAGVKLAGLVRRRKAEAAIYSRD